jgi:hypothetical protein
MTETPRKETILEDMRKVLDAQRKANEEIFEAKKARKIYERAANRLKAHYKVMVIKVRYDDGSRVYGSDPKIEAKVEECLDRDEDYQEYLLAMEKIDEEIFTTKLDLAQFDGEWVILKTEAALMAVE